MKVFVSALALGLVLAFAAPAFAETPAPKTNRASQPRIKRRQPSMKRRSLCTRSLHLTQPAAPLGGAVECAKWDCDFSACLSALSLRLRTKPQARHLTPSSYID